MVLNETPDAIVWRATHYVYVERIGPFMETAREAWGTVHAHLAEVSSQVNVKGMMSLYRTAPQMVYRAGMIVDAEPKQLPSGFAYILFDGGNYLRYTLKGSYAQLPQACGRVFELAKASESSKRDDFNIEYYANNPKTTPEEELITEILIPVV